jgi:hypothetical protein
VPQWQPCSSPDCCWYAGLQYRTSHNYKDPMFLGARLGDKILMAL